MRKISLLLNILFLFFSGFTVAQTSYKPVVDTNVFRLKADQMAARTKTIESDFVQVKELSMLSETITSKGHFKFKKENMLRWEYSSPYYYLIVLNKNKVMIRDDKKTTHYDITANKLFKEINDIMLLSINGTVFNSGKFDIAYFESETDYRVELTPLAQLVKESLKKIDVCFDKNVTFITKVELLENSGDVTQIRFLNKKLNITLDDKIFSTW